MKLSNKTINIVLMLVFLLAFMRITFNIPMIADDFSYSFSTIDGTRVLNVVDAIKSCAHEYMTWNGRFIVILINMILYIGEGQFVYRFIMPFILVTISVLVTRIITGEFSIKYSPLFLLLVFCCRWEELNQTVYWMNGFAHYVIPLIWLLICLIPVSDVMNGRDNDDKNVFLFTISGFLAGFSVEHYGLIALVFELISIGILLIRKKKVPKYLISMAIATAVGFAILIIAPGVWARNEMSTSNMTFYELIHWGYSRFIYCYFSLNLFVFSGLSILSLFAYSRWDAKKWQKYIAIGLALAACELSVELLTGKELILTAFEHKYLTDSWSVFYTYKLEMFKQFVVYGVIYLNSLILTYVLFIEKKTVFPFFLLVSSICGQLVFVITVKAVERAAFISTVLLIILFIICLDWLFDFSRANSVLWILLIVYSVFVSKIYKEQYQIYQDNARVLSSCPKDAKEVHIKPHNYKYVFRSDLNLNDYEQDLWMINAILDYYGVDKDVDIIFDVNE